MKKLIVLLMIVSTNLVFAQSEDDLAVMLSRVVKIDSVENTLGYMEEGDSIKSFSFLTLSYDDMGTPTYDYDTHRLVFDVGSNLLMAGKPYGKLNFDSFSKKKAELTLIVSGAGDREKLGKWTSATFTFNNDKNGGWKLSDTKINLKEK